MITAATQSFPLLYRKKVVWAVTLIIAFSLVVFYIFQLNMLTALAYHIADQEYALQQIKQDGVVLEMHAQKTFSLKELEQFADQMNFEKVQHISYLKVSSGSVAQNTR